VRIAGVRLPDGRAVWLDAGGLPVSPLDRVVAEVEGAEATGEVFVAPDQLLTSLPPDGSISRVLPPKPDALDCSGLPGASMPPLGTRVSTAEGSGTVIGVDAVHGTVTVQREDGTTVVSEQSRK
jgi:hypothetical protein